MLSIKFNTIKNEEIRLSIKTKELKKMYITLQI